MVSDQMDPFRRIYTALVALFVRDAGDAAPQVAGEFARDPWVRRGALDAQRRLGIDEDDVEAAGGYAAAYSAGAVEAIRLARAITSDPAVRGREIEALRMIEEGLGHAEVVAALRATTPTSAPAHEVDGNVIAFPSRSKQ